MKVDDERLPCKFNILLADDDKDDCQFFKEALEELPVTAQLTTVHDGDMLMQMLEKKTGDLPHVLFLDLNMPRKNGFACLEEIKQNKKLQQLRVIIISTSFDENKTNFYKSRAQYYICKPIDFSELKKVIYLALTLIAQENNSQPSEEKFILSDRKTILL